jgi:Raf kinase inhibitor-like YbhB/YbcL family protein
MADAGAAMALTLTSSAFKVGDKISSKYTCEGDDISPPLVFGDVPEGTKSLAFILDDPDAPDPKAPKRVWVHWLLYNLPADSKGLSEDASRSGLPKGTVTGQKVPVHRSDVIAISTSSTRSILCFHPRF